MTFNMLAVTEHDYIQSYERAASQLGESPDDRMLQHQAVLSLARAGSLDFAIAEYNRYGLSKIRHHEDIMALGGRLSKDLYLRTSGKTAIEHARRSAHQYEAAFQDTKGYYSGVNAATMALLAEMPTETILARVQGILNILPPTERLTPTDHYFIEATRAECFLLSGDIAGTKDSLKEAISFDPLNYTAHAATVKQFRMILSKQDKSADWLTDFLPPRVIHYAGHIWGATAASSSLYCSAEKSAELAMDISDLLQQRDIGFGYGALAAGSDILIAEALLQEGAELHVILPCEIDTFLEKSVRPFGEAWVSRFHDCLAKASSLKILSPSEQWPDPDLNRFAGHVAMGQSVMRGQQFNVPALQLLIWNQENDGSYTSHHAVDWQGTGREQIVIAVAKNDQTPARNVSMPVKDDYKTLLYRSDTGETVTYKKVVDAAEAALALQTKSEGLQIGIHVNIPSADTASELTALTASKIPEGILMSEAFASLLAHHENDNFSISFAGYLEDEAGAPLRSYALSR